MSNWTLFFSGLQLMVAGMGFVYIFLALMILCMNGMRKVLEPLAAKYEKPAAVPVAKASGSDVNLAAIAAAAVELFRKNNSK